VYESFFGLGGLPFQLVPDPRYLFLSAHHREALSNLQYGLATAKPVTVLLGEAGTGKTTLLRSAFESDGCRHVHSVYVNNPTLTRDEFVTFLANRFGLSPEAAQSKATFLQELETLLIARQERGEITALVVDEAQCLSKALLEEIRLLANVETATEKLLPLVLVGQPELGLRLNEPGLRQFKQRIALRCEITPFDLRDTALYIATRIRVSGGDASRLFTREAVTLIHEYSRGIPRTINVMCDNALLNGFALGQRPVGREIVAEVARDFDLATSAARNAYALGGNTNQDDATEGIRSFPALQQGDVDIAGAAGDRDSIHPFSDAEQTPTTRQPDASHPAVARLGQVRAR
jgi:general secretion pathway protein A